MRYFKLDANPSMEVFFGNPVKAGLYTFMVVEERNYCRGRPLGGIMISRRPNKRASTENAPGPRNAIAAKIAAPKKMDRRESNRAGVQDGSSVAPIAAAPKPIAAPAIGVRKPINRSAPAIIAMPLTNQPAGVESVPGKHHTP